MRILFIFILILLFGCDQGGEVNKDFDRTGASQKITVHVYETKSEMQKAKADAVNSRKEPALLGWSEWSPSEPEWGCHIHVVKLKGDKDTSQMKTWGHELAHCMYGSYHAEAS